ncbi:MAG: CBS domain-containing protein [Bacteroidetes bacterium]|nr:CBS domain-containing protein [Bacteroidota bacterium]
MIAKDLIDITFLPLKSSDTGNIALAQMDEYRLSHLPIVDNSIFQGIISDIDIYNFNAQDETLDNFLLTLNKTHIIDTHHIFDVIKAFYISKLPILPVLKNDNSFVGTISLYSLVMNYSEASSITNPGGIIVLELNSNDFSLSEIAQIVESNDAKLMNFHITTFHDSTKIEVTLKINKIDIQSVLQTFNRYNYIVKASFSENNQIEDIKERYDSLMNFLNI